MPPKLQVDESFAFLFTCIEASGCKIDFKLVGDATDLQPAAARMRYTRLRKAVESGHFKGATLTQPIVVSSSLSQLANPHSRRLAHATHHNGQQQQTFTGPAENVSRTTSHNRMVQPINLDEEEEEEEDFFELEDPLDEQNSRKRHVLNTTEAELDDQHLFFPDTSRTTRSRKKVKRSDSDEDQDEDEEDHTPSKPTRKARTLTRQPKTAKTPNQARAYPQQGLRQDGPTDKHKVQDQSTLPAGVSTRTTHATEQQSNNSCHSMQVSRRKRSANIAAEAAYEIGVKTGRWAPHPDDHTARNDQVTHPSSVNHIPHLRYIGQEFHSLPDKTPWNDVNVGSNMSNNNGPQWQGPATVPIHGPYPHHPVGPISFQKNLPGPFGTEPVSSPTGHQISHFEPNDPDQIAAYPVPRRYDPSDPNRFHPASVFDGFRAPTLSTYTSSPLASAEVKRVGEPSLLQKLRMDRQKDAEAKAASSEKAEREKQEHIPVDLGPRIKQRSRNEQQGATIGVIDNMAGEMNARDPGPNINAQVGVQHHDRPYSLPRANPRGSSASTHTITAHENTAANIRNDEVTKKEGPEASHSNP